MFDHLLSQRFLANKIQLWEELSYIGNAGKWFSHTTLLCGEREMVGIIGTSDMFARETKVLHHPYLFSIFMKAEEKAFPPRKK